MSPAQATSRTLNGSLQFKLQETLHIKCIGYHDQLKMDSDLQVLFLLSGFRVVYTYFLDLGKLYPQTGILLQYWSIVFPSILIRLQVDTAT
jgi:hypothetical protein